MDFIREHLELIGWVWIALGLITFAALMFFKVVAPFGRHTSNAWGATINNSLGWVLMELPSPTLLWLSFLYFKSENTPVIAYLPMLLWSIHYFNRTFIFPFRLKDKKKRMPVVIVCSAIFFNIMNGGLNGAFFGSGLFYENYWITSLGLVLFAVGMFINIKSDNMVIALRKPGETGYKIPKGFLFEQVSSPNLFGEIIEWFGFMLVAPGIGSLSFFIWTCSNLVPRARDHHNWYLDRFPEYPKNRTRLVPKMW